MVSPLSPTTVWVQPELIPEELSGFFSDDSFPSGDRLGSTVVSSGAPASEKHPLPTCLPVAAGVGKGAGGALIHVDERVTSPAQQGTVSGGYPDTGSIATFTSDKKPQFRLFLPDVMRKYPLQEVGTGRLKYHTMNDGTRVTFCGTVRPDAEGNVAACKNKPYGHQFIGLPNTCKRRSCPECYPDWSKKAAKRISGILNGYILVNAPEPLKECLRNALKSLTKSESPDDWKQLSDIQNVLDKSEDELFRHIVFSPDHDTVARLVKKTEKALEKRGIDVNKDGWKYRNEFHKVSRKNTVENSIRLLKVPGYMRTSKLAMISG